MARIRTIKPEFWSDEKLGPLEPIDRLVFLGLVSQADDAGRLVDSVRLLDGLLFGQTDDSCSGSLAKLSELGVIERGTTASGQPVLQIVGWAKHQRVDKPSNRGVLPPIQAPPQRLRKRRATAISVPGESREILAESSGESRENGARDSRYEVDLGSGSGPWTLDREREREREGDARAPEPAWLTTQDQPRGQPTDHVAQAPEPTATPTAADVGPDLEGFPQIAELVAGLKHQGGIKATAATIRWRFLFAESDETLADPVVKGLPLAKRERLVHAALLEYATQPEPFNRPHFTGFVRRIRDQEAKSQNGHVKPQAPPPLAEIPPADPQVAAAGIELVKKAIAAVTMPVSATVEDAAVVEAREAAKERNRRALAALKAKP